MFNKVNVLHINEQGKVHSDSSSTYIIIPLASQMMVQTHVVCTVFLLLAALNAQNVL